MIEKAEWWRIITDYLESILPTQYIFFAIAIILVFLLFGKRFRLASRLMNLYLSIAFFWSGTVFFLGYGRGVTGETYGNYFFSVVFVTLAVFYLIDFFRQKTVYELRTVVRKILVLGMILLYPIIGLVAHQDFLLASFVGTMPCPTVALALLLAVFAVNKPHPVALFFMLLWAIPSTPFLQIGRYAVYEDILLFLSGLFFLFHWITTRSHKVKS